jgi:hypothetical protein
LAHEHSTGDTVPVRECQLANQHPARTACELLVWRRAPQPSRRARSGGAGCAALL